MYWVIDENFRSSRNYDLLIDSLNESKTPYAITKLRPFINDINPDVNPEGPVFVSGGTGMKVIAEQKCWFPGYIDSNIDYEILLKHYKDKMLNYGGKVVAFKDLNPEHESFFVRPCLDNKSFSGTVMTREEFVNWQSKIVSLNNEANSWVSIKPDDRVFYSSTAAIMAEYRFFAVAGKIVTGSIYKLGRRIVYSDKVNQSVYDFAQQMIDLWSPNEAFVIDIAETPDGCRVLECNSINSAGFYDCDMAKIVAAINQLR